MLLAYILKEYLHLYINQHWIWKNHPGIWGTGLGLYSKQFKNKTWLHINHHVPTTKIQGTQWHWASARVHRHEFPAIHTTFLTLAIYFLWPLLPHSRLPSLATLYVLSLLRVFQTLFLPWNSLTLSSHFTSSLCWECFRNSLSFRSLPSLATLYVLTLLRVFQTLFLLWNFLTLFLHCMSSLCWECFRNSLSFRSLPSLATLYVLSLLRVFQTPFLFWNSLSRFSHILFLRSLSAESVSETLYLLELCHAFRTLYTLPTTRMHALKLKLLIEVLFLRCSHSNMCFSDEVRELLSLKLKVS